MPVRTVFNVYLRSIICVRFRLLWSAIGLGKLRAKWSLTHQGEIGRLNQLAADVFILIDFLKVHSYDLVCARFTALGTGCLLLLQNLIDSLDTCLWCAHFYFVLKTINKTTLCKQTVINTLFADISLKLVGTFTSEASYCVDTRSAIFTRSLRAFIFICIISRLHITLQSWGLDF